MGAIMALLVNRQSQHQHSLRWMFDHEQTVSSSEDKCNVDHVTFTHKTDLPVSTEATPLDHKALDSMSTPNKILVFKDDISHQGRGTIPMAFRLFMHSIIYVLQ